MHIPKILTHHGQYIKNFSQLSICPSYYTAALCALVAYMMRS